MTKNCNGYNSDTEKLPLQELLKLLNGGDKNLSKKPN